MQSEALLSYREHQKEVLINGGSGDLKMMVKENAVIVFAKRGCCLSLVVMRLLQVVGANPTVYEVEDNEVDHVLRQLAVSCAADHFQFPAVFMGGRWFGGLERIIATHITDELTPFLKQAGALWL